MVSLTSPYFPTFHQLHPKYLKKDTGEVSRYVKGSAFQNETYEKGAPLSVKNCIETSKGLNLGAELTQYKTLSSNPLSRPKWSLCSLVKSKHPLSSCLLSFYSRITFLG